MNRKTTFTLIDPPFGKLLSELNRLRLTGNFCDAVLATKDGATFPVHKVVMALCSRYFRTLFTTSLAGENCGKGDCKRYYIIPNVSSSNLEAIIQFAYSGKVDVNIGNINELLPAADQFDVPGVVEECHIFMLKNMTSENCVGVWRFGMEYFMPKLELEARRFFLNNFVDVSMNSSEFLYIKLENLISILNDNALNAREKFVWFAIKRWCSYKYEKRQHFIPNLLLCVRMALLLSTDFQQVMDDPRTFNSKTCRKYINMVSKYHLFEIKDISEIVYDKEAISMFTPRHPFEFIMVSGGWTFGGVTNLFEVYDCRADIWKRLFLANFRSITHHQSVFLGQYIYIFGGHTNREFTNSCWRIDTSQFICKEMVSMQEQRCYHSAAVLKNKIYAIGGLDGYNRLRTVEYYDPDENRWTYVSAMSEKRSDASAASLRNRIFIVGGFNGENFLQSAECYCADFDQWFFLPPMVKCRSGVGCVALDSGVYAIGGNDGIRRLNSVEKYSFKHREWFLIKPMERPRSNFAVAVLENKIYVMGGHNDVSEGLVQTECFDPIKYRWRPIAPLTMDRRGLAACTFFGIPDVKKYIKADKFRCLLKNVSNEANSILEHLDENPVEQPLK